MSTFYSPLGTIDRVPFVLRTVALTVAAGLAAQALPPSLTTLVVLGCIYLYAIQAIKRARAAFSTPFMALVMLVPALGWLLFALMPSKGSNLGGDPMMMEGSGPA